MISRILVTLLIALGFAGCESTRHDIKAGFQEKFSGPVYQRRLYAGEGRRIFEAARTTVGQMGFRITREGAAQGVIDGVSGITSDDRLRGSHQRTIKVRFAPMVEGGTEVAVLLTEVVEDDFNKGAGMGTEASLRGHPLYSTFFDGLTQALAQ